MISWEERRRTGIAQARAKLASLPDLARVNIAFADWWRERSHEEQQALTQHPVSAPLAVELRAVGAGDMADFAMTEWVAEGPIHPGVWGFSILLGESFVDVFLTALRRGEYLQPDFYGLDTSGAWEAFIALLQKRLRAEPEARHAVDKWLHGLVDRIKANPQAFMYVQERARERVADEMRSYLADPTIDDAWDNPFDAFVTIESSFLFGVMLEIDSERTLSLLAEMPHPHFVRSCFGRGHLTARPNELAKLIRLAPTALHQSARFLGAGMVAVTLLELAEAAIGEAALSSDGSLPIVPLDRPDELAPSSEKVQAVIEPLLDALFERTDAVPLAWAWLDRLVSHGKFPGQWPSRARGKTLNLPVMLIVALAKRLRLRVDWAEWIGERNSLSRVFRALAVFAVATFGQTYEGPRPAEIMEGVLIKCELDYPGHSSAISDSRDIVASLGGLIVASLDDPSAWLTATWEKLRPIRERNWRAGLTGGKRNSTGELLALWGVAALDSLGIPVNANLWTSVERAVRDATQTDSLSYPLFWSQFLVRTFGHFATGPQNDSPLSAAQLAQALLPYIAADHLFLELVLSLIERGWSAKAINEAVSAAGFDLTSLVDRFLAMRQLVPKSSADDVNHFEQIQGILAAIA